MTGFIYKRTPLVRFIFLTLTVSMLVSLCACGKGKASEKQGTDSSASPQQTDVSGGGSAEASADPSGYSGPDVPQRDAVGADYFSDSAFMGNSLMEGFKMFSGLTTCDYYSATSMTVLAASSKKCITLANGNPGTLVEGICQKPYGKIYIELGINEIGSDSNTFASDYGAMLDTIIAAQPDSKIYVMGLTPVTAAKSSGSDVFNMDRVKLYNDALRQLASDKHCYYLDLVGALAGEDGYLPADESPDGVHFSTKTYAKWLSYLETHYV